MIECPCKGCTKRYPGCHDNCKGKGSYQEWKSERDEINEKAKAEREINRRIDNQFFDSYHKLQRRRGRKY